MEGVDESTGEGVHQNVGPHEQELLGWLKKVAVQHNLQADTTIVEEGKEGLGRASVSATGVDPAAREAGISLNEFAPLDEGGDDGKQRVAGLAEMLQAPVPKERITRTYGRSPSVLAMVMKMQLKRVNTKACITPIRTSKV